MATATVAPAFKDAFHDVAVDMWSLTRPEVQVTFGHPGINQSDDVVGFMDIRANQEPANYGTNRSREETLELDLIISIYRGGGPEMEKVCSDRGYELLSELENYVRTTDTTLGGVVRHCFLISHTSDGSTDPQILSAGRVIEITATFQAVARITT